MNAPPPIGRFKRRAPIPHGLGASQEAQILAETLPCSAATAVGLIVQVVDLAVTQDNHRVIEGDDLQIAKAIGHVDHRPEDLLARLIDAGVLQLNDKGQLLVQESLWKAFKPKRQPKALVWPDAYMQHEGFMAAWQTYVKRRGGKLTKRAEKTAMRKLLDHPPHVGQLALQESNRKSYEGVFPEKYAEPGDVHIDKPSPKQIDRIFGTE